MAATTFAGDALEKAATTAGRRRAAAQSSLFDLANQGLLDELRAAELEKLSPEEAKALLAELKKRVV
jgi:hypothetical protein